jgi:hypothetical protein
MRCWFPHPSILRPWNCPTGRSVLCWARSEWHLGSGGRWPARSRHSQLLTGLRSRHRSRGLAPRTGSEQGGTDGAICDGSGAQFRRCGQRPAACLGRACAAIYRGRSLKCAQHGRVPLFLPIVTPIHASSASRCPRKITPPQSPATPTPPAPAVDWPLTVPPPPYRPT